MTRGAVVALAAVSVFLIAGCSAPAPEVTADPAATALLDLTTGEIVMPLSEYDILDTSRDLETINHALRTFVAGCMEESGFSYAAGTIGDEDRVVDDRPYGLWFQEGIRIYGFGFEPSKVDAALAVDRDSGGDAWADAEQACSTKSETDPDVGRFMPTNDELSTSIVPTIRTQAYQLASSDPAWQAAREKWWSCLRDNGLKPLTGATDWDTEGSAPESVDSHGQAIWSEASIQIAYQQAECNNSTRLTQTLADLEASYQAPLIEQNQSALNTWKDDKQVRLAAARDYIAQHG